MPKKRKHGDTPKRYSRVLWYMDLTLFSFFSGAGFLDLGFEDAGFKIAFVNEVNQNFLKTYLHNRHNKSPLLGHNDHDVTDMIQKKYRIQLNEMVRQVRNRNSLVGFIAGPPCPDFSSGGNHLGRNGARGKLTEVYINLLIQQQPDFFVFENVKGLWKTKRHREFYDEVKYKLHQEAGYITTENMVNALSFGVPQDRDRVILIGFHPEVLDAIGVEFNKNTSELYKGTFDWYKHATIDLALEEIKGMGWPITQTFRKNSKRKFHYKAIEELTVQHWFDLNQVTQHPNYSYQFVPKNWQRFESIAEGDVSGKSFKRLHRWRYSPTAAYGNNEVHLHPYKLRRISASEALAIQSLPTSFEIPEGLSLSSVFKMIGNGVPYLMARALAQTLREFLEM